MNPEVSLSSTNRAVKLQGPSFTSATKSEYEGEDTFIAVTGSIKGSRGSSTIRIIVSVGNPASAAIFRDHTPRSTAAPKSLAAVRVDNNPPLPKTDRRHLAQRGLVQAGAASNVTILRQVEKLLSVPAL